MRVLVGCEESGKVRDAFLALGHDAWSNDVQEARTRPDKHLRMDVMDAIKAHGPWDIIILHPPCTALAVSGNATYAGTKDREDAKVWTKALWELACKTASIGVCLENPIGVLWPLLGVKAQYIQPYQFGHPEKKKTGLALYKLPKLKETKNVYKDMLKLSKKEQNRIYYMGPSKDRAKFRSETYQGIAEAMASQWT